MIKGVETANEQNNQILGSADLKLHFQDTLQGRTPPVPWNMTVSFLPQVLKGVDIIVGQDWMLEHSCHILFDQGQCSLIHPQHPDRIFLNQMPTGPYHAPHNQHLDEPDPECERHDISCIDG